MQKLLFFFSLTIGSSALTVKEKHTFPEPVVWHHGHGSGTIELEDEDLQEAIEFQHHELA